VAGVEDLRRFPVGAREQVHYDRDVPGDAAAYAPTEEFGQFGGELVGDLLWDFGRGYQPQRHGVRPRGSGGLGFLRVFCLPFIGHDRLLQHVTGSRAAAAVTA